MTLVATSAKASGASGGPTVILDTTLGADSAAPFDTGANGIAATWRRVDILLRSRSSVVAATDGVRLTFNADTGNNYTFSTMNTQGATVAASGQTTPGGPGAPFGTAGASAPANAMGELYIVLIGPGDAFSHHVVATWGYFNASASNFQSAVTTLDYNVTAAITRAALSLPSAANWLAGSRCQILGYA